MKEVLNCPHKSGSDFEMLCIKVCKNGTIVGHVPREQLLGSHYCKSPLF